MGLLKYPIPNAVGGNEEVQLLRVSTEATRGVFVTPLPWRYGGTPLCRRVDHHEIEPFRIALAVHGGSPLEQLLDHVRLCLLSAKGTRAAPRPCGGGFSMCRIETISCAVNAEGHLNARIVVEVVTTFSSFQVL